VPAAIGSLVPTVTGRESGARRRWAVLAAMCLATAVTEFDETVMAVAVPSIDAAFDAPLAAVQWSVTAYVWRSRRF
jgi:MFS transporter, DHA2 family, multidrug resistance protein